MVCRRASEDMAGAHMQPALLNVRKILYVAPDGDEFAIFTVHFSAIFARFLSVVRLVRLRVRFTASHRKSYAVSSSACVYRHNFVRLGVILCDKPDGVQPTLCSSRYCVLNLAGIVLDLYGIVICHLKIPPLRTR